MKKINTIVYAIEYFDEKHINFFILDDGGNTYPNNLQGLS